MAARFARNLRRGENEMFGWGVVVLHLRWVHDVCGERSSDMGSAELNGPV